MNIRIVFRGMEHSASIETYVRKELEKVTKLLQKEDVVSIDLVLDAGRQHHHHHAELRLSSHHYHLVASHEGADLYQEIDHVVKTMVHEVKKEKEKALDKRDHGHSLKKDLQSIENERTKKELFDEGDED